MSQVIIELNTGQLEMLKKRWRTLSTDKRFGDIFYTALFSTSKDIKALFVDIDVRKQAQMLCGAIWTAISACDPDAEMTQDEGPVDTLVRLAKRHYNYGVKPEYVHPFCETFLLTLCRLESLDDEEKMLWQRIMAYIRYVFEEGLYSEIQRHKGLG